VPLHREFGPYSRPQLHPGLLPDPRSQKHPVPGQDPSFQQLQPVKTQQEAGGRVTYRSDGVIGKGSFGVVYKARESSTGWVVAIKAVRQRPGAPSTEEAVLRILRGCCPSIVTLLNSFTSGTGDGHMLCMIMEYVQDTLSRIIKHHRQRAESMQLHYVRVYMYQILRALANLDRHQIVHRDLKPANLLVDPASHGLKVCDFGTAKCADDAMDNAVYACSRYYRAPELILSTPQYGATVDLWAAGCILAEMLLGQPLFPGRDGVHQLSQIIEILGMPTVAEFHAMNPLYDAAACCKVMIEAVPWEKVFPRRDASEAFDLLGQLLTYSPRQRRHPWTCMTGGFFAALFSAEQMQRHDVALFELTEDELSSVSDQAVRERLVGFFSSAAFVKLSACKKA